jgi:oligopeptidase B
MKIARTGSFTRLLPLSLAFSCATAAPVAPPPSAKTPAATAAPAAETLAAPIAKRVTHKEKLHGVERDDPYFWLRQKDTPDVLEYLRAENGYTDAAMKPSEPFQRRLYDEMLGRIQESDVTVPYRRGEYFYYSRTEKGKQYPIQCRRSTKGAAEDDRTGATAAAAEQVLLDLNVIGQQHKFVGLGVLEPSDDQKLLAYSIDVTGFRELTLHFKDLTSGALLADEIPHVDSMAWAADGRTVFYVVEDAAKRPYRLYRHVLGSDPAKDPLVYEEKDERFVLALFRTRSRGYLVLHSESKTTTEERYLAAATPRGEWKLLTPREAEHRYYADHRGDRFYIRTDSAPAAGAPKARNFRLVTAPVASPERAHWKEILPHRDDVMLEDIDLFARFAVLHERADALPRLRIWPLDDAGGRPQAPVEIPLPEPLHALSPDENPEFADNYYRFHYESPITPDSVYDYDVNKRALILRKRLTVPGYDSAGYETARVHATAADGTRIPISLVYKKGLAPSRAQPHPFLLDGYGSYGISRALTFQPERVSLLDRGVVWAHAHIRGGGDLGKRWHEQGRMATKMNTFTDFITCAEELIKIGWTASDRLVIFGRSAGGLLMGAVTNLRPDLWKAVVTQVPFVDVINTMLDESLPLTVGEFEEWGNPKKKDEYDVMIRYSPYDNLRAAAYPAMLVTTSYNDSQVMYWEPAKFVAKLRALKTDKNPLLLRINMDPASHRGQSGRYDHLREIAFLDAFILGQLGLAH